MVTNRKGITPQIARKIRAEKGLKETKLYKMRVKRGLSQNRLAEKSGVSARTIKSFEQSEHSIDGAKLKALVNLCLALDCRFEDILESRELIEKLNAVKR